MSSNAFVKASGNNILDITGTLRMRNSGTALPVKFFDDNNNNSVDIQAPSTVISNPVGGYKLPAAAPTVALSAMAAALRSRNLSTRALVVLDAASALPFQCDGPADDDDDGPAVEASCWTSWSTDLPRRPSALFAPSAPSATQPSPRTKLPSMWPPPERTLLAPATRCVFVGGELALPRVPRGGEDTALG